MSSHPFLLLSQEEQVKPLAECLDWQQRRNQAHRLKVYGDAKKYAAAVILGAVSTSSPAVPFLNGRKLVDTDVEWITKNLSPTFLQYNITCDKSVYWYNQFVQEQKVFHVPGLFNRLGMWDEEICSILKEIHDLGKKSVFLNFDAQAKSHSLIPAICTTLQSCLEFDFYPVKFLVNSMVKDRFPNSERLNSLKMYEDSVIPLFPSFECNLEFRESSDIAHRTEMEYVSFTRKAG